jgi:hypothetical protein
MAPQDFSYVGYYDVDEYGSDFSNGLTVRYEGSEVRLMILKGTTALEYSLAGRALNTSLGPPVRRYSLGAKPFYPEWQSIYWDEAKSRLYVSSSEDYAAWEKGAITYYQIAGDQITASFGPVGLEGIARKRLDSGFFVLPESTALRWSLPRLVVGLGGYSARYVTGGASVGPAMYAIPDIAGYPENSEIPTTQFRKLLDKPIGPDLAYRGQRLWRGYNFTPDGGTIDLAGVRTATGTVSGEGPIDYNDGGDPRPNGTQTIPNFLPVAGHPWGELPGAPGRAAWTWMDRSVGGFAVDGQRIRGVAVIANLGAGRIYYAGGAVLGEGHATEVLIYDPEDLGRVSRGAQASAGVQPVHIVDLREVGRRRTSAAAFDPKTSRLYVRAANAGGGSRVFVYAIAN